jgi:predicted naringenin-chalcone synthase
MSSATVLFVLKHIMELPPQDGDERICSMAFGPGLTVETAMFTKVRAPLANGTAPAESARTEPSFS